MNKKLRRGMVMVYLISTFYIVWMYNVFVVPFNKTINEAKEAYEKYNGG